MKTIAWILATLVLLSTASLAAEIPMQPVDSSFIAFVGYDAESETLAIQMHNSSDVFHYADVPQSVADEFVAADSIGRYFVENIKGQYSSTRIE
jgi:hypothetical protein